MTDKYGNKMDELKEQGYFVIGLKDFIKIFSVIHVLMGYTKIYSNSHLI